LFKTSRLLPKIGELRLDSCSTSDSSARRSSGVRD